MLGVQGCVFCMLGWCGRYQSGTEGKSCSAENRTYHETCAQSWVGLSAPVQNKANVADSARSRISTSVVSSHLTRRICLLRQMHKILPPSDELKPKHGNAVFCRVCLVLANNENVLYLLSLLSNHRTSRVNLFHAHSAASYSHDSDLQSLTRPAGWPVNHLAAPFR